MLGRPAILGALIALLFESAAWAQGQKSFLPKRLGQIFVIQYALLGPKSAWHRPILLIHQTSLSHLEYTPLALELAHNRPVVAIGLPGYGASDPLPRPVIIEKYADAVADGVAALHERGGYTSFDVIGTHGGSLAACQHALAHPDLVHRLVVNDLEIGSG